MGTGTFVSVWQIEKHCKVKPVFEKSYFTLFSDFKKHDFTFLFEMTYQKVVKSQ